ncbi:ribosomal RNA small subunit methyltransferase C [Shewanella sp. OPT22]|nr:ribosomal RNA small subunit methyltransferase C [Shewanella sp. OPT22]
MLTNPSQLISRNQEYFKNKSVLLLNHESDQLLDELKHTAEHITSLALDYNHYLAVKHHQSEHVDCQFGHQLSGKKAFDCVVIYYPKAKPLAEYLNQLAANHLLEGGELYIVGENKGGVKSVPKQLPNYFSKANKIDNARHCLLYAAELESDAPPVKLKEWVNEYHLKTPQGEIKICNLVGVFSQKQLDKGTELLLENLAKVNGRVLDFGCGAGVITAALLKDNPELQLDCVDINAMALASCEMTMTANGFKANVYASDCYSNIEGKFDAVISNPPFHDGLKATTDIAERFVKNSADSLKKGGVFQIVANRHLPYSEVIATNFGDVNACAENNKYKIYLNRK